MSFRVQRLANAFPGWTKARKDPSSLTQRFFEPFAELSEEQTIFAKRISLNQRILKPWLGIGHLHQVILNDDEAFPASSTAPGVTKVTYPTLTGTILPDVYALERYEDIVSLLNAPPDRISQSDTAAYTSFIVYDSNVPFAFVDPERPERLKIEVSDSTFYSKRTRVSDRAYSGKHAIQIVGTDENDISIREYVTVNDDGVFCTSNIFKTVSQVQTEGFDGRVLVRWFDSQPSHVVDIYRAAVFNDFEGQLKISLATKDVGGTIWSFLVFGSDRFKQGQEYRRPGIETSPGENFEELATLALLDSTGLPFEAVDIAMNNSTATVYVVDTIGRIHVFDHELPGFTDLSISDTETTDTLIEIVPLRHYAEYGNSEYVYTDFRRLRDRISYVQIKRRSPSGTVEYLQSDRSTWSLLSDNIVGIETENALPEKTWNDFRFSTNYNEVGQWEYSITVVSSKATTVHTTAVSAGYLQAVSTISSGVASPTGIDISKEDWIGICDTTDIYWFSEHVDGWLADVRLGRVLLREPYEEIEVTY